MGFPSGNKFLGLLMTLKSFYFGEKLSSVFLLQSLLFVELDITMLVWICKTVKTLKQCLSVENYLFSVS